MTHTPVMLHDMLDWLAPKNKGTYIDGTFGAGGYSQAILKAADARVFAVDRDPTTRRFAETIEKEFPGRFVWLLGNFCDMCSLVATHGIHEVDGIVLDLGVSSMQIDTAERGFSFKQDGPLDMRMAAGEGMDAATLINHASERELADILYHYGEEKAARRIAHAIVQQRAKKPIETTRQLADIIRAVVGRQKKTDPATRSFQALRIHVNHELEALEKGLTEAESLLAPGGKLIVVSFHSLEDRLVKRFMSSRCGRLGEPSRHAPIQHGEPEAPHFFLPKPEKRLPSEIEANANPRARSAVMRMMVRAGEES